MSTDVLLTGSRRAPGELRDALARGRPFVSFVVSVGAVNASFLLGNALAFRFVDPSSMGVWHTLLLANAYLTIVRLGLVNGMGRELPFALGRGDLARARRIAATALAFNTASCVAVALAFAGALAYFWSSGSDWRWALPAMGVVGALNLYLAYLQATFRSDRDFARLSQLNWVQAATGLLLPPMVYAFGFAGLCLHAALQAVVVTAFAHARRPFPVSGRFEGKLASEMVTTGFPLFAASYALTVATGFDRVILLQRGTVETVGLYAPALAVLAAMAVVPGAVSTWVFPRMSYAFGRGETPRALRNMALGAAGASLAAGLPVAVLGWTLAPQMIARFFPQYLGSVQAVRYSLISGLLLSLSPATQVLGTLKSWPSLALTIAVTLLARWAFPWVLSDLYPPLEGVARGNVWASAITSVLSLALVCRVTGSAIPERNGAGGGGLTTLRVALGALAALEARVSTAWWTLWARLRLRAHGATVGRGLRVRGPLRLHCHRTARIHIGDHCRIQSGFAGNPVGGNGRMSFWVGPEATLTLGHRVGLSSSTIVCLRSVTLEDEVFLGGDSKIYDTDFHSLDPGERSEPGNPGARTAPVLIRRRAFVGGHSILLKGTTIGEGAVVGAGSVVRSEVPARQVWAGNPARFLAPLPARRPSSLSVVVRHEGSR